MDLVSKEISKILEICNKESLRTIAIRVAEYAVDQTGLAHSDITKAVEVLRKNVIGDCSERLAIKALADKLDDIQFDLKEKYGS